jgi:TonB family protein
MKRSFYLLSAGVIAVMVIIVGAVMISAMQERSSIEPLTVASAVAPAYPVLAVASNTSGTVLIEVQVNPAGEVISARATDGHQLLRESAQNTARRWRFAPVPVEMGSRTATLTFVFRIMPKETQAGELTAVFTPPYSVEVRHRPFEPVIDSDPPSSVRPPRHRGRRRLP